MNELAILVPVLDRPHFVGPLLDTIHATVNATTLFVVSPGDDAEVDAIEREGAEFITVDGGYAAKINAAVGETTEPLLFLGADDLRFRVGWFEAASARVGMGTEVVGINDLISRPHRPRHATHFLVSRRYAEAGQVDGEPGLLHEGYDHSCTDDELIATATARGAYTYAEESQVEHLHPMAGHSDDPTYRRGRARIRADRQLFRRREALWT